MKGKADYGYHNIRNPQYVHWQQYVGVENRCVAPVTSFAEPSPTPNDNDPETGIQRPYRFARSEDRLLFFPSYRRAARVSAQELGGGPGDFDAHPRERYTVVLTISRGWRPSSPP